MNKISNLYSDIIIEDLNKRIYELNISEKKDYEVIEKKEINNKVIRINCYGEKGIGNKKVYSAYEEKEIKGFLQISYLINNYTVVLNVSIFNFNYSIYVINLTVYNHHKIDILVTNKRFFSNCKEKEFKILDGIL